MMGYRFSLATLLRYRESLEHRCWMELQAADQAVRHAENALAEVEKKHREWRQWRIEKLNVGIQAARLEEWGESYYTQARDQFRTDLQRATQAAETKVVQFSKARQEREILSNMRVHAQARFESEQARREQARLDELFLIRRSSGLRGDH